jgi:hypothetical protein
MIEPEPPRCNGPNIAGMDTNRVCTTLRRDSEEEKAMWKREMEREERGRGRQSECPDHTKSLPKIPFADDMRRPFQWLLW